MMRFRKKSFQPILAIYGSCKIQFMKNGKFFFRVKDRDVVVCGGIKMHVVNGQWSMVNGQWSMVNGQWSMVNGQWSMVNGQWSMVNRKRQYSIDNLLVCI